MEKEILAEDYINQKKSELLKESVKKVLTEKRHRARLIDPSKFKTFRTDKDKGGKGVDFVYGIRKKEGERGGKTELQAITFDPKEFSTKQAKIWLKKNKKDAKFTPSTVKESVELEEAGRPIFHSADGKLKYSIVRKVETDEWVAKAYVNGKYDEDKTIYETDQESAIASAKADVERWNKMHTESVKTYKNLIVEKANRFMDEKFLGEDEDEDFVDEAQEDDAFITDNTRGGYDASCSGKFLGNFREYDDAVIAIGNYMKDSNWFPNVWNVSDHGNMDLIKDFDATYKKALEDRVQVKAEDEIESELERSYEEE